MKIHAEQTEEARSQLEAEAGAAFERLQSQLLSERLQARELGGLLEAEREQVIALEQRAVEAARRASAEVSQLQRQLQQSEARGIFHLVSACRYPA